MWVKEWFLEQEFLKRIRRLDLDTTLRGEGSALIPAPGRHRFWYERRPFWVWFSRTEETKGWTPRRLESLTFRTVGREQWFLKRFVDEIVACHKKKIRLASYLYVYDDGWIRVLGYTPRMLEAVIPKPGEKEHLLEDIRRFRAARKRYCELGVPYHRGYLLYGPPGTGKTSLVSGFAATFGMSVYAINLTEFNDRTLKSAVSDVPARSVILFEDIDCMKAGDARPSQNLKQPNGPGRGEEISSLLGVTLSGLLNVLDGFNAPEDILFVMTTNKIETLDLAFLRPGRIDYRLFLGKAASSQKISLYRRFFPEATDAEAREFVDAHESTQTMAEFQGLLLALEQEAKDPESVATDESHGILV